VARSCLEAWGGCASIMAEGGVARLCLRAWCGRADVLAVCTIFVAENFGGGFDGGFSLAVLLGFFEE